MIVLVRHGQTAANANGLFQGRTDLELSRLGIAQADALASHFATTIDRGVSLRILSSPLKRALATALPIASALGIELAVEPALTELDYGDWDGRPLSEVTSEQWSKWRTDPRFVPPGGESLVDVRSRVETWLASAMSFDGVLIAVTHMSPIKAAACSALAISDAATWRMRLDLASVTRLSKRDGEVMLSSFNETPAAYVDMPNLANGNK